MAIKAGQILHVANQFVVDRIQTGGPGDLNIPQERVYELGNYQSVGIVRDVPDLSFNLECLDVDTEVEALLTGSANPYTDAASTKYELLKNKPIDIISPWKTPFGDFTAVRGVAIPGLALESASYRYGLQENAGETFTLNGDSIFYIPGTPWQDIATGDNTTVVFNFQHGPALPYNEGGKVLYALSVSVDGERLTQIPRSDLGNYAAAQDRTVFANTSSAGVGVEFPVAPTTGAKISIVYGSTDVATYPQTGQDPYGAGTGHLVHQGVAVKPAAIRGKDIDVYFSTLVSVGGATATKEIASNVATVTMGSAHNLSIGDSVTLSGLGAPYDGTHTVTAVPSSTSLSFAVVAADAASSADVDGSVQTAVELRWPDVQSATVEWRVTLEEDYEFGNPRAVARDATDVPAVSGAIELRPRSVEAFFARLRQITGVKDNEVIGPQSSVAGALRIELRNPGSGGASSVPAGTVLKTHYIPDARFTIPGYSGQVQQKLGVTLNWESDTGELQVFKGPRV